MVVNDELDRMWTEAVVAYFTLLFQFRGTEGNTKNQHKETFGNFYVLYRVHLSNLVKKDEVR
jgi:hypothetical protein